MIPKKENKTDLESQIGLSKIIDMNANSSTNIFGVDELEDTKKMDNDSQSIIELKESKFQFSNILDNADDVIITMDEKQLIRYFNRGAEKAFQLDAEDVIGKEILILLPERFRNTHPACVRDFSGSHDKAGLKDERTEIIGLRKDGTEFPAEVSISKITIEGHKIFSIFLRDITKRRKIEAN